MLASQIGAEGECVAVDYLRRCGYQICALNWRSGRYELDIVAQKGCVLHFVEVKTRRSGGLTTPEQAITAHKFRSLTHAATHYLAIAEWQGEVQFDLIAVLIPVLGEPIVEMVECAMESHW